MGDLGDNSLCDTGHHWSGYPHLLCVRRHSSSSKAASGQSDRKGQSPSTARERNRSGKTCCNREETQRRSGGTRQSQEFLYLPNQLNTDKRCIYVQAERKGVNGR